MKTYFPGTADPDRATLIEVGEAVSISASISVSKPVQDYRQSDRSSQNSKSDRGLSLHEST
jgi:hypothetical protein